MIQLSFVVPSYNAEKYLDKCLRSLIVEDALKRIEVIVVNDGSNDATEAIAQRYVDKYPECFRLINKPNGGHGSGINAAVAVAKGRYVKVVDADDWIISENLCRLLNSLESSDADAVINEYKTVNMKTGKILTYPLKNQRSEKEFSISELMNLYDDIRDCCSFHGLIYKLDMYRAVGHTLTEGVFYEDQEYATIFFAGVKKVLLLPFVFYVYLIGNGEQSIAFHNQVKRISHIRSVLDNILSFYEKNIVHTTPTDEYFMQKMSVLAASYLGVALVKNPHKKSGRVTAREFVDYLHKRNPALASRVSRKYKSMKFMNILHLSPALYQVLLDSPLYRRFRQIWTR